MKKTVSVLLTISMLMSLMWTNVHAKTTVIYKIPDEINFITSHNKNDAASINLSWINPDYDISSITVTEPVLGTVSEGENINLESGKTNYIGLTGLEKGNIYTFTVSITKTDGTTEMFTNTAKTHAIDIERNTEEAYGSVWYFKYDNKVQRAGRYVDSAVKHNGESSLKIVLNDTDNYVGIVSEGSSENARSFTEGYTYEYSFWSKNMLTDGRLKWADDYKGNFAASNSSEWKKNTYIIKNVVKNNDGTWSYVVLNDDNVEVYNIADGVFNPRIIVEGTGVVWIDDIELYITDSEGKKSSNLYRNGRFEADQGYYGTSNINAKGENASAVISWTNPNGIITEAVVVDEKLQTVGIGDTGSQVSNSITVNNLTNLKLYKYYIRIIVNGVTQYIPVTVIPKDNGSAPYITHDGYKLPNFRNWGWSEPRVKVTLDTETKYAGDSSLHINFASGSWGGLWPETQWGTLTTGKNYRLSIWAKNSANSTGTMRIDDNGGAKYIDIPEKTTEWTQFTYDFNATSNGFVHRINEVFPCTGDWWFDELEICEIDEIGGNVIGENVYKEYDEYSFDGAGMKNVVAVPDGTDAYVSFFNADNIALTDVYVTDENGVKIDADFSALPGAFNEFKVSGLAGDKIYKYYIVGETADGYDDISQALEISVDDNLPFKDVMGIYHAEHNFSTQVRMNLDYNEVFGGVSSLRLQTNYNSGFNSFVIPINNLDKDKVYQISFWSKVEDRVDSNAYGSPKIWVGHDWGSDIRYKIATEEDVWTECKYTFTGKTAYLLRFGLDYVSFGNLWIDELSVKEYDTEKEECIGENLVFSGDFDKAIPLTVLSADISDKIENYFKLESELYMTDGEINVIELEGDEGVNEIVSLSPDVLKMGKSSTVMNLEPGWYKVKSVFDYDGKLAVIEVVTPKSEIIRRADPDYMTEIGDLLKINVKSTGKVENPESVVKNLKINKFEESDLLTEISINDIRIYDGDNAVGDFNCVPVSADRIEINLHSPLIDKVLIDEAVSVKGANVASTEYVNGIYTINISEGLIAEKEYSIIVSDGLTGETKIFDFTAEPEVYAKITGISKEGTDISEISELSVGDTVTVAVDYINLNNDNQKYSVYAAGYASDGRLINAQVSDGEFTFNNFTGVNEIKFFVWDLSQNALADDYILPLNSFEADEVYNLVTTFYGDEGTTRGFAWTAIPEYKDMVIQYAEDDKLWGGNNVSEEAAYTEYEGLLYYKADVEGLEPGETYVYRIGDKNDNVWSDFYTFTTEPENISEFKFIGITDPQSGVWGGGYEYMKYTLDAAMKEAPETSFIVNLGDLTDDGRDENHWKNHFRALLGYGESLPYMAVLGNHEARGNEITSGKNFSLHFNNPKNGADALGNLTADDVENDYSKGIVNNIAESVYSFDYGNAHFAVLNTGSDWSSSDSYIMLEEQKKWLEEDLKASDKKWKIVMLHQGLYPAKTERWNTRSVLGDVIDECGVDLVLAGHDHIVTRTYPMKNGEIVTMENPDVVTKGSGTVYTILGSSGPKRYDMVINTPEYAAVLNATASKIPSYSIFNVNDNEIEVVTKQITGEVVDKFIISE